MGATLATFEAVREYVRLSGETIAVITIEGKPCAVFDKECGGWRFYGEAVKRAEAAAGLRAEIAKGIA